MHACEKTDSLLPTSKSGDIMSSATIGRHDFPPGFIFGAATSAYQIEGAVAEDGRGATIWDSFSHIPGNIRDGTDGDVTADHYHKYKEDVQLMADLGIDAYRFSISWARIFPDGKQKLNLEGVAFYNKLINSLLLHGIEPYVTLYHWDMPQALEDDPNIMGWRTKEILKVFAKYATTCFELFGDRVKNWATFNEIRSFALDGYGTGNQAPGRCSQIGNLKKKTEDGDSSTEPYIVAHNALLSHAIAAKIYKTKFQVEQKGRIGMCVDSRWYEAYTNTAEDILAAQRCIEFELGWMLDPIFFGDYPRSMRDGATDRLPQFTKDEVDDLKGSIDFIGLNYYTAYYAQNGTLEADVQSRWYQTDRIAIIKYANPNGELIGELLGPADLGWIYDCPWGLPKLLQWFEDRYGKETFKKLPIIITENGTMDIECNLPFDRAIDDVRRIEYICGTLQHLCDSIKKCRYNVQGYFVWSILDNFEWDWGLTCRYGLYYVDFDRDEKRYPKKSAKWFQKLLQKGSPKSKDALVSKRGCSRVCSVNQIYQITQFLGRLLNSPRLLEALIDYVERKYQMTECKLQQNHII